MCNLWSPFSLLIFIFASCVAHADYVEVVRNAKIYASPNSHAKKLIPIDVSDTEAVTNLILLSSSPQNGYYAVRVPGVGYSGWIYKSRIRIRAGEIPNNGTVMPPMSDAPLAANEMRVHYINVGQGDAALLEFTCGVVLVDSGGESNDWFDSNAQLSGYLEQFFLARPDLDKSIDLFILTHPHIDHTRGSTWLRENSGISVLNYIDNGQQHGSGRWQQINWQKHVNSMTDMGYQSIELAAIGNAGLTSSIIDPVNCDAGVDPEITILWGQVDKDPGWGSARGKPRFNNTNNHSIAVRVDFGNSSFLFTGDMEHVSIDAMLEKYKETNMLDVDIYQVGHHGSKNATIEGLMRAMSPDIAVISAGDITRQALWTAWKYGHPHQIAINLLRHDEFGVNATRSPLRTSMGVGATSFDPVIIDSAIYNTGWDGHIVIKANDQSRYVVMTER